MDYERGGRQKDFYAADEVISRDCPFCKSGDYVKVYQERGSIGIVRCKSCELIYTNPIVKEPEKNYWGDKAKYYEEARLIFKGVARSYRDPNYIDDLRLIEKVRPSGAFLDIGTNAGFFLRHTRGKAWDVVGIEPSPSLSEMARKYFGLNVKTAYLDKAGFEDGYFEKSLLYRNVMSLILDIVVRMGYEKIVLLGVDLDNWAYFYENLPEMKEYVEERIYKARPYMKKGMKFDTMYPKGNKYHPFDVYLYALSDYLKRKRNITLYIGKKDNSLFPGLPAYFE